MSVVVARSLPVVSAVLGRVVLIAAVWRAGDAGNQRLPVVADAVEDIRVKGGGYQEARRGGAGCATPAITLSRKGD